MSQDIPIIMSAPMIRALLDGSKTMTRRLAWRAPAKVLGVPGATDKALMSPWQRVKPGDRLWVREGWRAHSTFDGFKPRDIPQSTVWYLADDGYQPQSKKWPCIFMPRWASRLTLIVTATKVERLQDIRERECIAEGAEIIRLVGNPVDDGPMVRLSPSHVYGTPRTWFRELWGSLHGSESWDANPEVVCLSFTVHKANIDTLKAAA